MTIVAEGVAGAVKGIAGPLFNLVDELFTSDEERAAAKVRLVEMEQEGKLEELKLSMSGILAEANSTDPWTSRARPTFLYVIYTMILLCVIGAVIGIWFPDEVTIAATNLTALLNAIPESLWWLFGAGYLGYTGARSFDKWRDNG